MPLYELDGRRPQVHETAFVAETATLIGEVFIEEGASIWYGAVLRADYEPIIIRAGANVQDNSVMHSPPGHRIEIGRDATVGHLVVIHGASLDEEALIANGATILDGVHVGARSLVAAGSVVAPGTQIPPDVLVMGVPAKVKGPLPGTPAEVWVKANPQAYRELAQRYRAGVRRIG